MPTITSLIFEMSANSARLQADMAKARSTVEEAMGSMKSAASLAQSALASLGIGLSAAGFIEMTKGSIEFEASLVRLAEKGASTVEEMSSLIDVAKRSHTDLDAVAGGMNKLASSMADAQGNTGKAAQVFEALHIGVTNLATGALRPTGEVMQEFAQKLVGMKDQTLAAAFAKDVLGKGAKELIPYLIELAAAGQLDAQMTTEQAKNAKALEDKWIELEASGRALRLEIANGMTPALLQTSQAFIDLRGKGGDATGFFETTGVALKYAAGAAGSLWLALKDMGDGIGAVGAQANALLSGNLAAFRAIGAARDAEEAKNKAAFEAFQAALSAPLVAPTVKAGSGLNDVANPIKEANTALSAYEQEWNRIIALTREADKAESGLAASVNMALNAGDFGKVNQEQRNELVNLAAQVDRQHELAQAKKELAEGEAKNAEERAKQDQAEHDAATKRLKDLDDATSKWKDIIYPSREYQVELQKIADLEEMGRLTWTEADIARHKVLANAHNDLETVSDSAQKADAWGRQMGLTFSSTFENAMIKGKGFHDVLTGIEQDIEKIILRQTVTQPAGSAISGLISKGISGLFGGEDTSVSVGALIGTDYGGTARAGGGPVNSGSTYIVGEEGPELFVPGSSGSIVPNDQLGGGGGANNNVQLSTMNVTINVGSLDPRTAASVIMANMPLIVGGIRRAYNQRGFMTPMG